MTQSAFSQIMGSLLLMPVLVLRFHGTPAIIGLDDELRGKMLPYDC